jgi:hypothetical protein
MPVRPDDTMGPRQSQAQDEVLVEDITDRPESAGEEEGTKAAEAGTSAWGRKERPLTVWKLPFHSFQMQSPLSMTCWGRYQS